MPTLLELIRDTNTNEALAMIQTGNFNPEQVDTNGNTALFYACDKKMPDVAMALIQTGQSRPEQVNKYGTTALIYACDTKMPDVAMALIQTGQSKPEQVNKKGITALILACYKKLSEVAMALIQTGQSKPEQVDNNGNTALIFACQNNMPNVALALIQTGQSKPEQVDNNGNTALQFAENNNMNEVVAEILKLKNPVIDNKFYIDTTKEGFDSIHQETIIIQEYLKYANNLCFKVGPQCFLINRDDLKRQLDDKQFHRFECKQAGDSSQYILDNNIKRDIRYLITSSLFGMRFLIKLDDLKNITDNSSKLYTNLYSVIPTGQILPAIISQEFIDGGGGIGADHCQTGKEIEVYKIVAAYPLPCPLSEQSREQVSVSAIEQEESINILYKNNTYKLPINMNTLIGEIKTQLLNTLLEKGVISSINQNVKFLFGGKVYMDNAIPISQITNPPFGKSLNAMISPIQGGTKKRKYTKNHKHKTKKQKRKYTKKHKKQK